MSNQDNKQFTLNARTSIKGEAFFESLITDYSIPHQISGAKDIGVDYICEWVYGDDPTGILFAAQVKTFTVTTPTIPRAAGIETRLNGLEKYTINNSNLTIDDRTLRYWKGLGLPMYLFVVVRSEASGEENEHLDCYYRRFTPVLTKDNNPQEGEFYYKVNSGHKFIAFANPSERLQGFARDLYVDLMRWAYYNGSIAYLNPRRLGLMQFSEVERVYQDLFAEYKERIRTTYDKAKQFLGQHFQ